MQAALNHSRVYNRIQHLYKDGVFTFLFSSSSSWETLLSNSDVSSPGILPFLLYSLLYILFCLCNLQKLIQIFFLLDNGSFLFYMELFLPPSDQQDFYWTWLYEQQSGCLIRNRNRLPFVNTWVHPLVFFWWGQYRIYHCA